MVLFTVVRQFPVKELKAVKRKFIDSLRLHVTGGAGGMGLPKYGGLGGEGGDIYAIGKEGVSMRNIMKAIPGKRLRASNGENSRKNCILGMKGEDKLIEVPLGVTVFNEKGVKLGEVNEEDSKVLVARGGLGGSPNTGFSGTKGESQTIILDLKLIADIGLVGFPNAGKSTLLSILSKAKPKIASYPFTTIQPNIGIIKYDDLRVISMADLPGLIEGAHINIGMGHKFLKHVERTKLLLFVVDISGFRLSHKYKYRSCLETLILLNKELELYDEDLLNKPAVLVVNKMDKRGSQEKFDELLKAINNYEEVLKEVPEDFRPTQMVEFERVISMSAIEKKTEEIEFLKNTLRDVLDNVDLKQMTEEAELVEKLDTLQTVQGPVMI